MRECDKAGALKCRFENNPKLDLVRYVSRSFGQLHVITGYCTCQVVDCCLYDQIAVYIPGIYIVQ